MADFLGVSNLMDARADGLDADGRGKVQLGEFELVAGQGDTDARGDVKIVIRPERVRLEEAGATGREPGPRDGGARRLRGLDHAGDRAPRARSDAPGVGPEPGGGPPYAQGHPVSVHLPADALRVLVDDRGRPAPRSSRGRPPS